MKTLTIILLLTPFVGFTQSKKELRAEISKYLTLSASLESDLRVQTAVSDSLRIRTIRLEEQNAMLEKSVNEYKKSVTEYTEEISRLEEELDNCMAKGKPASQTKQNGIPTKPGNDSNPFGGNGTVNGNTRNDNPFGNDGGISKGKGVGLGKDNARVQIKTPSTAHIHSTENCTIKYSVSVAPDGKVVNLPTVIKAGTTTTDKDLIDSVAKILQEELLYNKITGTQYITTTITIKIAANQ